MFGAGKAAPEALPSQHLPHATQVHTMQANPYAGNQLNPAAERLLEHMGHDSSALEVAALLSTSNTVDIQDRLKSVGLQALPFNMIGDKQLFQALWADTCAAKTEYPTRVPFTYWDLTSNTVLPPWLPGESVGGKAALSPDETLGTDAVRLAKTLAGAVSKASNHARSFTKFSHWAAAFWRWATAAISCGQLTWVGLMAHFEVVCQIAHREQHTYKKAATFLAMLHDELARRALAQRTRARDPEISGVPDIEKCRAKIDKQLLEMAKSRLVTTMANAGLDVQRWMDQPLPSASSARLDDNTASAMAKQSASLSALTREQQNAHHRHTKPPRPSRLSMQMFPEEQAEVGCAE